MQPQAARCPPETAGLLGFQSRTEPLFPRRLCTDRGWGIAPLLVAENSLLNKHAGHVADRAGFLFRQRGQSLAEILRQNHLDPRGFGLPA